MRPHTPKKIIFQKLVLNFTAGCFSALNLHTLLATYKRAFRRHGALPFWFMKNYITKRFIYGKILNNLFFGVAMYNQTGNLSQYASSIRGSTPLSEIFNTITAATTVLIPVSGRYVYDQVNIRDYEDLLDLKPDLLVSDLLITRTHGFPELANTHNAPHTGYAPNLIKGYHDLREEILAEQNLFNQVNNG